MIKKIAGLFLSFLLLLSGCSASRDTDVLALAIEDIKTPIKLMDERFSLLEGSLDCTASYLDNPDSDKLESAKTSCFEAVEALAELPSASSSLSAEDRSSLIEMGMVMADYDVPFQYSDYYRFDNIQTLTFILYFLTQAPAMDETLAYIIEFQTNYLKMDKQIECLGINSLFIQFDGAALTEFKDSFLPGLRSLSADSLPWETDMSAIEAKASYLFSQSETDIEQYAEFMGEKYKELLEAQNVRNKMLSDAYGQEKAQEILSNINTLEQAAGSMA